MKLKLSILVISFLSVFINSTSNASSDFMTLALKPHVVVNREADSKVLTLGDLIEVEKTSPQIVQRYSGVSLEGFQGGTLQASHVLAVLKKEGLDLDQVALEPPTQVQVVFVEDEIKEEKKEVPIVEAAKSDLAPVILSPKKGDTVTLLVSSQDFKIRALGRVKEVQDNGNHILVENLDSKKELWGRALNASEVEIVF